MTWIDFMSQFGGNCGLCLGISLLSVVEIFYWFSVKLCKNFQTRGARAQQQQTPSSLRRKRGMCSHNLIPIFSNLGIVIQGFSVGLHMLFYAIFLLQSTKSERYVLLSISLKCRESIRPTILLSNF